MSAWKMSASNAVTNAANSAQGSNEAAFVCTKPRGPVQSAAFTARVPIGAYTPPRTG